MSTSSAAAAIAASNAGIAAASAQRAKAEACTATIVHFDSKTATVAQMQAYADCVETIYPDPMSPATALFVKLLIISAFVGAGIAGWHARCRDHADVIDTAFFSFTGALIGPIAVVVMCGAAWCVRFLFTV